jgi:hypothetical protein
LDLVAEARRLTAEALIGEQLIERVRLLGAAPADVPCPPERAAQSIASLVLYRLTGSI